jgi:hypothetical protein
MLFGPVKRDRAEGGLRQCPRDECVAGLGRVFQVDLNLGLGVLAGQDTRRIARLALSTQHFISSSNQVRYYTHQDFYFSPVSWVLTHGVHRRLYPEERTTRNAYCLLYHHNTISRLSHGLRDADGQEVEMLHRHGYADGGTSSIDCLPADSQGRLRGRRTKKSFPAAYATHVNHPIAWSGTVSSLSHRKRV